MCHALEGSSPRPAPDFYGGHMDDDLLIWWNQGTHLLLTTGFLEYRLFLKIPWPSGTPPQLRCCSREYNNRTSEDTPSGVVTKEWRARGYSAARAGVLGLVLNWALLTPVGCPARGQAAVSTRTVPAWQKRPPASNISGALLISFHPSSSCCIHYSLIRYILGG